MRAREKFPFVDTHTKRRSQDAWGVFNPRDPLEENGMFSALLFQEPLDVLVLSDGHAENPQT